MARPIDTRTRSRFSSPAPRRGAAARPRALLRLTRRRVLGALILAAAAVCWRGLYASPLMLVRHVEVHGVATVTPDEAEQARAAVSIGRGANILRLRPQQVTAPLCRLPWVAGATISRRLPGTIRVAVTPRRPVADVIAADASWEVDVAGHVIRPGRPANGLPVVRLLTGAALAAGDRIDDSVTLAALSALGPAGAAAGLPVAEFAVDQSGDICLNMKDSTLIRLGQDDDLPAKLALAQHIYRNNPNIGAEVAVIDLRCPDAPACTRRTAAKEAPRDAATAPTPTRGRRLRNAEPGAGSDEATAAERSDKSSLPQ